MAANWTAFVAGQVLTASELNGVVDNFADVAIFNETQANGTNGGTFTSGSYIKRTLNTTIVNNITGCSIASSVITLPAGTFEVLAQATAQTVNTHKARLQNTTASSTALLGANAGTASGISVLTNAVVQGTFVLTTSSTVELQHRCTTTKASDGYGAQCGFGDNEIYSQITIRRIA